MKYIYILGMEHSGSTLTSHLLSRLPNAVALGEVQKFFAPRHMLKYMARWGTNPDARLCSCGRDWAKCDFWRGLMPLCGLHSDAPLAEKYERLLSYVQRTIGADAVVIDSSKSQSALDCLHEHRTELGLLPEDFLVLWTMRDVRGFVKSLEALTDGRSIVSLVQNCNRWLSVNRGLVDHLKAREIRYATNLYESLCADPERAIKRMVQPLGIAPAGAPRGASHIVLGNKGFLAGDREAVSYDARWRQDGVIKLIYWLHLGARTFNRELYRTAGAGFDELRLP